MNDALLGRTIAQRYRLLSWIGAGRTASVFLARNVTSEQRCAIKIIHSSLAQHPLHRERFLREARAVNRINHPNIVEVHDFGEADGLVYLVMEYVPGEPLRKTLAQGPLHWRRAASIGLQIASALGRAHQMGIIHNNIGPANILTVTLPSGGELAKLTDFGSAKLTDRTTQPGMSLAISTQGYLAPETLETESVDARSDLFSLGVVLYEAAAGILPFDVGDRSPLGDSLAGVTLPSYPHADPLQRRAPGVPPLFDEVVMKLLAPRAADRPRDGFEAAELLREVLEQGEPPPSVAQARDGGSDEPPPSISGPITERMGAPPPSTVPPPLLVLPPTGGPGPVFLEAHRSPDSQPGSSSARAASFEIRVPRGGGSNAPTLPPPAPAPPTVAPFTALAGSASSGAAAVTSGAHPQRVGAYPFAREPLDRLAPIVSTALGRLEGLRAALGAGSFTALDEAARVVAAVSRVAAQIAADSRSLELLQARARALRGELGAQLDEAAREHSRILGWAGNIAERTWAVESRRLSGEHSVPDVEVMIWEQAALEQEQDRMRARAAALGFRTDTLKAQLNRASEGIEREIFLATATLEGRIAALRVLAADARITLDGAAFHLGLPPTWFTESRSTAPVLQ
jgi:eukaryotic-like serine/threonine-protein kinase